MAQKVIKAGNSAAVTLPAEFVRDCGIRVGDSVKVIMERDKGKIIYIFSGVKQLLLAENFLRRKRK